MRIILIKIVYSNFLNYCQEKIFFISGWLCNEKTREIWNNWGIINLFAECETFFTTFFKKYLFNS